MASLRQRAGKPGSPTSSTSPTTSAPPPKDPLISLLDVVRVLTFGILLSCGLSYFITDGESVLWGYNPHQLSITYLSRLFTPPLSLTPAELRQFDGTDPSKPLYLAINGSVFDVSSNRATYGPGGSYAHFAGVDGARAFVSGCFKDDITHDLRGLEAMYVKGKDAEEDEEQLAEINTLEKKRAENKGTEVEGGEWGEMGLNVKEEGRLRWLKQKREKRWADAKERVDKGIRHWDNFFRTSGKYFYVGEVRNPSLAGTPVHPLCQRGKPKPGK